MDWVVVVDDEEFNRRTVERVLKKNNVLVTTLASGEELLDYLLAKGNRPDLILLDIMMPGLDGFETKQRLADCTAGKDEIPVIFLTGDESRETEMKALRLGAVDFIKKPIFPEVLMLRVKHTIELDRMRKSLSQEVERRAAEWESLSRHVVQTLAEAIDAKDKYTKGHSGRVALYSQEIAKRYGYDEKKQDDIYMMGLLHDVGKIGVPDTVINKKGRLTDEEFEMIKVHPAVGDRILKNIREMPELAVGARWHHERYDGRGYPDGLKGEDIPEQARIIAVADAYDAMTSHRSYRDVLAQEVVRSEIEKGRGSQFDPVFADIMLQMIDEDTDYTMHEE